MKNSIQYYFNKLLKNDVSIEEYSDDAFGYRLFFEIHGTVPYVMYFFDDIDGEDNEELIDGEFDLEKTLNKVVEETHCEVYRWKNSKLLIHDNWIVFKGVIFSITPERPDELSQCIVMTKTETANLVFVSVNSRGGFIKRLLPVTEVDIDYDINYNEDFPHEKIEELITSDKSELILTFGLPGTGNIILINYIY